jgi:hypothetical protein
MEDFKDTSSLQYCKNGVRALFKKECSIKLYLLEIYLMFEEGGMQNAYRK